MNNMMRSFIAAGLLAGCSFSVFAQTAFVVKGNLKDTTRNGEKVFLSYYNGEKSVYTTTVVKDGAFVFEGTVQVPARASLSISTTKEQRKAVPWIMSDKCEFFIESGEIN